MEAGLIIAEIVYNPEWSTPEEEKHQCKCPWPNNLIWPYK